MAELAFHLYIFVTTDSCGKRSKYVTFCYSREFRNQSY